MSNDGGAWCILRCQGRSTLRLAATLAEDGFEVWTPAETIVFRQPRRNSRRPVTLPMMPGYVFARAAQVHDLLRLSHDLAEGRGAGPGRPNHHRFTVWLLGRGMWTIADGDMAGLRQQEATAKRRSADQARRALAKKKGRPVPIGTMIRVPRGNGAFQGMIGRVVKSDARNTKIVFSDSRLEWSIRTSLLDLDDVGAGHP